MKSLVTQFFTNRKYSAKLLHPLIIWVTKKMIQLKLTRQWTSQISLKLDKTFKHQWIMMVVPLQFRYLKVSNNQLNLMATSPLRFLMLLLYNNRIAHRHLALVAIRTLNNTGLQSNKILIQSAPPRMSFSNLMPLRPIEIREVVK